MSVPIYAQVLHVKTALLRRGKSQPRVVVNQIRQKGQRDFLLICGCRSRHSPTVR